MPLPRRTVLTTAATAGALVAARASAAAPRRRRRGRRPNIVVILADDLGYGALGSYGQQVLKTPHLDRLAAEGIRFTQGYAGASVCAPSRTTLLTGMHGGHARVRANTQRTTGVEPRLLERDVTIAEVLGAAGYRTGVFGKWGFGDDDCFVADPIGVTCELPLPVTAGGGATGGGPQPTTADFAVANRRDRSHPLQKGFDSFLGLVTTEHAFQYWPDYLWRGNRRVRLRANDGEVKGTYAPEVYLDAALDFVDEHRDDEFLLYFAPQLVHFPNQVPDAALAPYADKIGWTDDQRAYAAQYTLLDAYVGRIVARLKKHGLDRDTLVVFTGDNGPTPNEHLLVGGSACADVQTPSPDSALADVAWNTNGGLRAGKHSLYEGGVRVPLIAWGPGVVRRHGRTQVAGNPWGSVDLLPTLADIAGVTAPSDVDGVSVRGWITGEDRRVDHPPLYFERPPINDQNLDGGPPSRLVYTTAIRWGRWKGVRHAPGDDPHVGDSRAHFELYDLTTDPAETRDVAALHPDIARRLQARMRAEHAPPPFQRRSYRPRRTGRELRLPRRG